MEAMPLEKPALERDSLNGKITLPKLGNLATTSGNVISFRKHLGRATNIYPKSGKRVQV